MAALRIFIATLLVGTAWIGGPHVQAKDEMPKAAAEDASKSDASAGLPDEVKPETTPPRKELLPGKAVLLADALKRRGIKAYDEEVKGQIVLETAAGELFPIVPDWRGRAFFQDERLRDRAVDLIVQRRPGIPYLQVLSIFTFDEQGARQLTDYWCDICSIPMYELKDCECCQGPIRLRYQRKDPPANLLKPAAKSPSP